MQRHCSVLRSPLEAPSTHHRRPDQAAQTLITLVQSCYPSASVIFPHISHSAASTRGVSSNLDVLPSHLQSLLAGRGGLGGEVVDADRLLARAAWDASTAPPSTHRPWWEVMTRLSAPLAPQPSKLAPLSVPSFRPDAVVYIDGVEVTDVATVVAPRLMEDIPNVVALDNVGSGANTHGGERQEPIYCRRKVDWARYWREKRCAMRGADLMELSLPLPPHLSSSAEDAASTRTSLLVAVANPSVTLATLHRQKKSHRRGPLRTTFGYSLPCLQSAVPDAAVLCVRLLRAWQQRSVTEGSGDAPCTSAFWVSAVGRLLSRTYDGAADDPIGFVVEEWLRHPEKMRLTSAETLLLRALTQSDAAPTGPLPGPPVSASRDLLAFVLFSAIAHQAAARTSLSEWNATNYFLPSEEFDGTTDSTTATALSRCGSLAAAPTRSMLEELLPHTRR